jgi:hypothetical protein
MMPSRGERRQNAAIIRHDGSQVSSRAVPGREKRASPVTPSRRSQHPQTLPSLALAMAGDGSSPGYVSKFYSPGPSLASPPHAAASLDPKLQPQPPTWQLQSSHGGTQQAIRRKALRSCRSHSTAPRSRPCRGDTRDQLRHRGCPRRTVTALSLAPPANCQAP